MAPVSLFDDEDDNEEAKVTINKKFARDYEAKKLRQELKERQDEDDSANSSSSDEEEDEAAVLLTTKLDTSILKTIHALRSKDERIYDPQAVFFEEQQDDSSNGSSTEAKHADKPKYMKDIVREQVLEDMKKGGATDDDMDHPTQPSRLMYDETQQEARQAFLKAVDDMDDAEEPVVVLKSSDSNNAEDETEFMQELEKLEKTKGAAADTLVDPKGEVKDGEAFLLNFFKQRPWKEEDGDSSSDESHEEIVPMKTGGKPHANDSDEDSLEHLDYADTFEAEYNFRFEQAAQDLSGADQSLQKYSRVNTISMRRPDDRRKTKRAERAERKAAERKEKEEQLKRLKNAKRKEMEEKLAQLKSVIGSNQDMDDEAIMKMLEGDFDPEQFESLMKETYNEEYYNQEDPEWKNDRDVRKSLDLEFPDDEDGDLYDDGNEDEEDQKIPAEEEQEYDEEDEMWPEEEPAETELEQKVRAKMEDELYKLDYEDIVAGMPTRFKYRQVEANNYGLSTEEILLARDTTLKQFVSLKKMAPYAETEYRVHGAKRRKFRELLKQDIEEQAKELEDAQPKEIVKKKKRRLRKKEKRAAGSHEEQEKIAPGAKTAADPKVSPTEKKRKKETDTSAPPGDINPAHQPEGLSPTSVDAVERPGQPREAKEPNAASVDKKPKKKKRKKKHKVQGVSAARMDAYGL